MEIAYAGVQAHYCILLRCLLVLLLPAEELAPSGWLLLWFIFHGCCWGAVAVLFLHVHAVMDDNLTTVKEVQSRAASAPYKL